MAKIMFVLLLLCPLLAQSHATTTFKEISSQLQNQRFVELDEALQRALPLRQPPPPRSVVLDAAEADAVKESLLILVRALTEGLNGRRGLLSFHNHGEEEPAAAASPKETVA
ncbi:unnamed protein product [Triticum turgidum subsp. durum]|uniref:Uncharacterized protein n=1 Tax=Triticum turgidum subsp. durum TaxID=4567 RepID=A0A9R0SJQ6_TRITD|nr:unnamed protein product [Triticum turgidum subsp. durum]